MPGAAEAADRDGVLPVTGVGLAAVHRGAQVHEIVRDRDDVIARGQGMVERLLIERVTVDDPIVLGEILMNTCDTM